MFGLIAYCVAPLKNKLDDYEVKQINHRGQNKATINNGRFSENELHVCA